MKEEIMGWQWHHWDDMQIVCTSLQTDNDASASSLNFFTDQMLFPMPNQHCRSSEGHFLWNKWMRKMATG